MRRFYAAPLIGLQQALCTHAAVTRRFYSRQGPVSSFQLGSYKLAASFSRLAPTAGSLKNYLRSPLRHSFWAAPQGPFIQFGTILPNLWQKVKYKFSFVGCGGTAPRASGGCLAGSAAEGTFFSPSGWRRSAGLLFLRGKSRQKRAGETPAPLCLPNRTPAREHPVATEIPLCPRLPRNRCSASRTSAVAPRADGHFLLCKKTDESIPLTGPTAEASMRSPPQIRCPEDLVASVAAQYQIRWRPIRQRNPKPWFWRFFGSLLCVQK